MLYSALFIISEAMPSLTGVTPLTCQSHFWKGDGEAVTSFKKSPSRIQVVNAGCTYPMLHTGFV